MKSDLIRVRAAAELLGVHENTVRNLERSGVLKASRDYKNHRLFNVSDLLRVKTKREQIKEPLWPKEREAHP